MTIREAEAWRLRPHGIGGDAAPLRERRMPANERRAPIGANAGESCDQVLAASHYRGPRISPVVMRGLYMSGQNLAILATGAILELIYVSGPSATHLARHIPIALTTMVVFSLIRILMGMEELDGCTRLSRSLVKSIGAMGIAELAAIGGYNLIANWSQGIITDVSFGSWASAWFFSAIVASALVGLGVHWLAGCWRREGRFAKRIVVFGGGKHGARFIGEAVRGERSRTAVRAYFDDRLGAMRTPIAGVPCGGNAERLIEYVRNERVDEVIIALPWSADERILGILGRLRHLPVPVRLAPETIVFRTRDGAGRHSGMDTTPIIRDQPISEWGMFLKELFDRASAALLLLCASPVLAVIAILIKRDSPGPVLFRQKRLGFNGRPFDVLKFRTMTYSTDSQATLKQANRSDRRVTAVGRFLRRTSLDELPQLVNVLNGDMSLVGPRPHPMWQRAGDLWPGEGDRPLDAILTEYASRHRVKPGITGWAQVCGYRGETETIDKMAKRVEHDLHYIDHWSLWLDVKILFLTVLTTVAGKNAY